MKRIDFLFSMSLFAILLSGCIPGVTTPSSKAIPLEDTASIDPIEKGSPREVTGSVPHDPPANCPVTIPPQPEFAPPSIPFVSPLESFPNEFWFGSEHLWTAIPEDAIWYALPHNPQGYTQKIFWWSDLFSLKDEPQPDLIVTGQRLDAKAPPLNVSKATNAYGGDIGESMLVGVDFPTLGCWEITGQYKESKVEFVVWVAP